LVAELLADDPFSLTMNGIEAVKYVGLEEVDGRKAHRIRLAGTQFDKEVWIASERDPLPLKVTIDLSKQIDAEGGPKIEVVHRLKNWKINIPIEDHAFRFEPPASFVETKSIREALGLTGISGVGRAKKSPLIGKPAPNLTLPLLDGGEFRLEDHTHKRIVVLAFWATWCGPCVSELPIIAEVAHSFKDRDVTFVAINRGEKLEQIRLFQKEHKFALPVALDIDSTAGKSYSTNRIPALYLIDKEGTVRAVHVGNRVKLKSILTEEIDAILAGKPLVID
jgi:peroxiredoxin